MADQAHGSTSPQSVTVFENRHIRISVDGPNITLVAIKPYSSQHLSRRHNTISGPLSSPIFSGQQILGHCAIHVGASSVPGSVACEVHHTPFAEAAEGGGGEAEGKECTGGEQKDAETQPESWHMTSLALTTDALPVPEQLETLASLVTHVLKLCTDSAGTSVHLWCWAGEAHMRLDGRELELLGFTRCECMVDRVWDSGNKEVEQKVRAMLEGTGKARLEEVRYCYGFGGRAESYGTAVFMGQERREELAAKGGLHVGRGRYVERESGWDYVCPGYQGEVELPARDGYDVPSTLSPGIGGGSDQTELQAEEEVSRELLAGTSLVTLGTGGSQGGVPLLLHSPSGTELHLDQFTSMASGLSHEETQQMDADQEGNGVLVSKHSQAKPSEKASKGKGKAKIKPEEANRNDQPQTSQGSEARTRSPTLDNVQDQPFDNITSEDRTISTISTTRSTISGDRSRRAGQIFWNIPRPHTRAHQRVVSLPEEDEESSISERSQRARIASGATDAGSTEEQVNRPRTRSVADQGRYEQRNALTPVDCTPRYQRRGLATFKSEKQPDLPLRDGVDGSTSQKPDESESANIHGLETRSQPQRRSTPIQHQIMRSPSQDTSDTETLIAKSVTKNAKETGEEADQDKGKGKGKKKARKGPQDNVPTKHLKRGPRDGDPDVDGGSGPGTAPDAGQETLDTIVLKPIRSEPRRSSPRKKNDTGTTKRSDGKQNHAEENAFVQYSFYLDRALRTISALQK